MTNAAKKTTPIDAEVILVTDNASLWYHPKEKIVHHAWHSPIESDEFRQVLTRGVEFFEQEGGVKWLSDDRGNTALHPDDADWAKSVWAPRVLGAGWKFWAIVMPEDILGKMNMRGWKKHYSELGVEVEAFTDADEAFEWLASRPV